MNNNLSQYIFNSNISKATELLKNGADINAKYGEIEIKPIISAINSDNPATLEFVIKNGADVNIDNGNPLHEIIDYCFDGMSQEKRESPFPEHLKMVEILLKNGANLEILNSDGRRPIDVIKTYSPDEKTLAQNKCFFKHLIPNIDTLL